MRPEWKVSGEIQESSQGPVNVVLVNLRLSSQLSGLRREPQTFVEDEGHPGRLGTLRPGVCVSVCVSVSVRIREMGVTYLRR